MRSWMDSPHDMEYWRAFGKCDFEPKDSIQYGVINAFKYHVSCTDGKISVVIKINNSNMELQNNN